MPSCPVCRKQCQLVKYEGVKIDKCGSCGGHWLTEAALDEIVEKRGQHLTPQVQDQMLALADQQPVSSALVCPSCRADLKKIPFRKWKEVVLHECPNCADRWLYPGILEVCQIYAQQLGKHAKLGSAGDARQRKAILGVKADAMLQERRDANERRRGFWMVFRILSRIFVRR